MPFQREPEFADRLWGKPYGEYLTSFVSVPTGQVRADVYKKGNRIEAHVSFPTGVDSGKVTEKYVADLGRYAEEEGFADRFHLILAEY